MTRPSRWVILGLGLLAPVGCQHDRVGLEPAGPVLPARTAVQIVNGNVDRIEAALQATGTADGHVTNKDGKHRSYNLHANLFYLAPRGFRLDLRKLGTSYILVVSNDELYCFYSENEDFCECGRHDAPGRLAEEMPVEPQELLEALGLSAIPVDQVSGDTPYVQRISDEHQQLLFLTPDEQDRLALTKEYWLDRRSPRLVGRVVFRDRFGRVQTESHLRDYRRLGEDGPWLPYSITIDWPAAGSQLQFNVHRWRLVPQVKADGVQFAKPPACRADGG